MEVTRWVISNRGDENPFTRQMRMNVLVYQFTEEGVT